METGPINGGRPGVPEDEGREQVLWQNAAGLYGL